MCTSDPLLLQDDERQRTDCLNCGLHIDLKKQIFLGIIMKLVDIGMARWYNQGVLGGMTGELYDSFQSGKWFWTL